MIFRLFAHAPVDGWFLICSVEAPDARGAMDQARQMIKPQQRKLPMRLVSEHDAPPSGPPAPSEGAA